MMFGGEYGDTRLPNWLPRLRTTGPGNYIFEYRISDQRETEDD